MSGIYEIYVEELDTDMRTSTELLENVGKNQGDLISQLRQVQSLLKKISNTLRKIENEGRLSPEKSATIASTLVEYRKEYINLQRTYEDFSNKIERLQLKSVDAKDAEARQRQYDIQAKISEGTHIIEESLRMSADSEAVSLEIMRNLDSQHETMNRSKDRMRLISRNVSSSRSIIGSMGRRGMRTKIFMALFALILLGVIIGIIVWQYA